MIELKDVYLTIKEKTILRGINLKVNRGEFVFLSGPIGAGKSSILRLIHFDLLPTMGTVRVEKFESTTIRPRDIPRLRRMIGFIFQDYKLLKDRDIFDNVAFALRVTGIKKNLIHRKTMGSLAAVGMTHKRMARPEELSGGECQRVAIARALALEPFILLADEPTGNLDSKTSYEFLELLTNINRAGTAVIMATHNEQLVSNTSFRAEFISEGMIRSQ